MYVKSSLRVDAAIVKVISYFFVLCNTSEEFFVKKADRVELMSFVGLFGAIIGAIQMYPSNSKG
ncbi:hypothetical protein F2Q68_00045109 [Brassica cretica]|uniref:Uncharacterized protein n=1 Tax=Brassica cretica TaxID=69181 RepID=A0A8S9LV99_BRACR|nr:hypothetical protein F2Q68_00045109 [Brassica cretica]